MSQHEWMRVVEAMLFAATEPLDLATLASRLPEGTPLEEVLQDLQEHYSTRGVHLVQIGNKYALRTAPDLAYALQSETTQRRKLSRPALETLAIIAYHQPVTRAEIEEIRGVSISKGTLDVLLATQWVKIRGRKKVPGRPITYGTSEQFLAQFDLTSLDALPGLEELKATGLLDNRIPEGFSIPTPEEGLDENETPLADDDDGSEEFLDERV